MDKRAGAEENENQDPYLFPFDESSRVKYGASVASKFYWIMNPKTSFSIPAAAPGIPVFHQTISKDFVAPNNKRHPG
jgi:hypothetical protein